MRFFLNCNDGISPNKVQSLVKKYGKDLLIGVDPGLEDRPVDEVVDTIEKVKELGLKLHVYLVGVGMWSWSEDEQNQIEKFAESVGIDTNKPKWHKNEWLDWGWRDKIIEQFQYYHDEHNAYSCEIDNLDSALKTPEDWMYYFKELSGELEKRNIKTKLMIKNLSEEMLELLIEKIEAGELKKEFFCEFGMFEEGSGEPSSQIELCTKIGIKAITPESGITDTNHYGVIASGVSSL